MNKEDLLSKGYRKYSGEKIEVYFSKDICTHSGNCVRTMPKVFDIKRKPWILADNGEAESAMKTIDLCPSGALQYIKKRMINNMNIEKTEKKHFIEYEEGKIVA